ncbi:MAG: hypothetical protein KIC90_04620 [Firmicutes bacterium]|jgi:hypothetical protein|nr:hypothetical protein [Bacillota bacterium]CDE07933.1 unknown [Bacillus sp. CAG:988]DAZ19464.1 MAG TPA: hypothetical protein [Caudoviricetes sp.]
MDKLEKLLSVLGIIIIILITIGVIWFVVEVKEMLNDYRCSQLPINEFFQDEKCERYWRYR